MKDTLYRKDHVRLGFLLFAGLLAFLILPLAAHAADLRVTPIRLEFDQKTKSGVLTLMNEGQEEIRAQLSVVDWSQDEKGEDVYTESQDITFFPKITAIEPGGKKLVRVGVKQKPGATEKTYRLFVEEIPRKKDPKGVTITIALRFGVPVFIAPRAEEPAGEVVKAEVEKGKLRVGVRNSGNVHFMIKSISVTGKDRSGVETFTKELSGWYLLSGKSRLYETEIPGEVCAGLASIDVGILTAGSRVLMSVS
jgi:fimbrial chaperone protein